MKELLLELRNAIMICDGEEFSKEEIMDKVNLFRYQLEEVAEVIEVTPLTEFDPIHSAYLPYDLRDISNVLQILNLIIDSQDTIDTKGDK